MDNKIIIIGCPRSGTGYASKFFNIGHETLNQNGISSWCLAFDKPLYGPDLQKVNDYFKNENIKIYHQVRNPLKVISSFQSMSRKAHDYFIKELNLINSISLLEKYIKIWVKVNKKCELISEFTYKVEDIEHTFPDILSYKDKKYNSRKHTNFTLNQINNIKDQDLLKEFKDLSLKYGYVLEF
tara:strand:+ start:529 stop:1077 length:549 start_codon:yes stop_codon:yes gene_type:complete